MEAEKGDDCREEEDVVEEEVDEGGGEVGVAWRVGRRGSWGEWESGTSKALA